MTKAVHAGLLVIWVLVFAFLGSGCTKKSGTYKLEKGDVQDFQFWITRQINPKDRPLEGTRSEIWGRFTVETKTASSEKIILGLKFGQVKGRESAFNKSTQSDDVRILPNIDKLNGLEWTLSMDAYGRNQIITEPVNMPPELNALAQATSQTMREIFPNLPDKLQEGVVWKREAHGEATSLPGEKNLPLNTVIQYNVKKIFPEPKSIAQIGMSIDITLGDDEPRKLPTPPGQQPLIDDQEGVVSNPDVPRVMISGQSQGGGELLFDLQKGRLRSLSYETTMMSKSEILGTDSDRTIDVMTKARIDIKPYKGEEEEGRDKAKSN